MMDSIWQSASDEPVLKNVYEILQTYARQLRKDKQDKFLGDVIRTIADDGIVIYAFYLIVPALRNYSYRLIEVEQRRFDKFYPVNMRLFGTAPGNIVEFKDVSAKDFEEKLREFVKAPLTQHILHALEVQIRIIEGYNSESKE